ncbi:MAG: 3-dehydroquinate synthase [Dysgonamonadaceae bacterium]|nr:3-dehydroquinate synthase [Dysgonamonadaceae bacterium]
MIQCDDLRIGLQNVLKQIDFDLLFILSDTNTATLCLPLLQQTGLIDNACLIQIPAGEANKNLDTLASVWTNLCEYKATRRSLLLNLGGGMVTDLGGFAASTFKRGIRFINLPTTLLAAVDAAVGGKTGIDFHGLKNEIGAFAPATAVLIDTAFFKTLDHANFLSGYAEMLKHSLIHAYDEWQKLLRFDLETIHYPTLSALLTTSVKIKEAIVASDPKEKGLRKALNFGHTIGHAMESFCLEKRQPVLHGYAVAWGMACELYLSFLKLDFDRDQLSETVRFIKTHYGTFAFNCDHYDRLYELMLHDKKNNNAEEISFTLIKAIGDIRIDQVVQKSDILEAFDFFREFC